MFIAHADGSSGGRFSDPFVCVSLFRTISKTDAARITKLLFHDESWKPILVVNRSKVKVTSHRNITAVGLCTLLRAGFL